MDAPEDRFQREVRLDFVDHFSAGRMWGSWFAVIYLGVAFYEAAAPTYITTLMALGCLVWPQAVRYGVRKSRSPYRTQQLCMYVDGILAGVALAVVGFKSLPSALLAGHLALSFVNMAGAPMLMRGLACIVGGALLGTGVLGFHFHPDVSQLDVYASLPFILLQPMIVGYGEYRSYLTSELVRNHWKKLSHTDSLTGIDNRRSWEEAVDGELKRYQRYGGTASLLLIDIDYFKSINDRYGHRVGDEVIRAIARLVQKRLRKSDSAGRYGGEEFGVLLPATPLKKALHLAERLRRGVESQTFASNCNIRCTLSIGVVELSEEIDSFSKWIDRADKALYQGKAQGRNQVVAHRQVPAQVIELHGS